MDLQSLQRAFQVSILGADDRVAAELAESASEHYPQRSGVYTQGYRSRLLEALSTSYPVLRQALGDACFDAAMRRYIDANPSRHYSIRYYGDQVPGFIAAHVAGHDGSAVADLARWEWTLADVFDAADDAAVAPDRLTRVSPAAWATVSFGLRASVRTVHTRSNAVQWWRSAQGECAAPATLEVAPECGWLLWRSNLKTLVRSMDTVESRAIASALAGENFGQLCEAVAREVGDADAPLRAASLLRGWFAEELIADLHAPSG